MARNLVFKASGTVGAEGNARAMVLLAFDAPEGTSSYGWPAVLRVADAQGRKAATRGRVFGLGEARSLTFSSVIDRDGDGQPVYADLVRANWNRAENRVQGTFLPPVAAGQVSALYRRLRNEDSDHGRATRAEIDGITAAYGQAVDMPVRLVATGLRSAPEASAEHPTPAPGIR